VLERLLEGYRCVEAALADGIDMFAMGRLKSLLELNSVVLCGSNPEERTRNASHLAATERRFYEEESAGIRDVLEWQAMHAHESVWRRAAGTYIRILSEPQLFLEGNHRTGALIVSYMLGREGLPPFVLSKTNAAAFFDPSTLIRSLRKRGIMMLLRLPGLRQRLASFLAAESDPRHLISARTLAAGNAPTKHHAVLRQF